MIRLTELLEVMVAKGIELGEPNPVVRIMVHGREGLAWFVVESVIVDRDDESVIMVTVPADESELEHWG